MDDPPALRQKYLRDRCSGKNKKKKKGNIPRLWQRLNYGKLLDGQGPADMQRYSSW